MLGRQLEIRVDGVAKTAAEARGTTNRFSIPAGGRKEASQLAERLNARSPCLILHSEGRRVSLRQAGKSQRSCEMTKCLASAAGATESKEPEVVAASIGTCGPVQINEGGNVIPCRGLSLSWGGDAGRQKLTVTAGSTPGTEPGCKTYLSRGRISTAAGTVSARKEVSVGQGPLCAEGVAKPLGLETRVSDVEKPACKKVVLLGGTHVTCAGVTYSFGGPHLRLTGVKALPSDK